MSEAKLIATFLFQQLHDYLSEDNNITKTEFISQFTHNSPGLNPIANGLFLEFDMNHDDTITHEDIDQYYMKLDTNGKNTNNTKNLCFSLWYTFVEIRQVWKYQKGIRSRKSKKGSQHNDQEEKGHTTIYKALHRKLKVEQHESH